MERDLRGVNAGRGWRAVRLHGRPLERTRPIAWIMRHYLEPRRRLAASMSLRDKLAAVLIGASPTPAQEITP